eukprot:TRINITY_DN652_c0_g1_i1.p1 TRINITY_DN652_c0_g1~~TRINITY_DN652_c0_g1_i1.p1  ORF type:complete len:444 (-),score=82.47 TRINITY_DN652_c0_g1_i1:462-1793(-)
MFLSRLLRSGLIRVRYPAFEEWMLNPVTDRQRELRDVMLRGGFMIVNDSNGPVGDDGDGGDGGDGGDDGDDGDALPLTLTMLTPPILPVRERGKAMSKGSAWNTKELDVLRVQTAIAKQFSVSVDVKPLIPVRSLYDAVMAGLGPDCERPEDFISQMDQGNHAQLPVPLQLFCRRLKDVCVDTLRHGGDPSFFHVANHVEAARVYREKYPGRSVDQKSMDESLVKTMARYILNSCGFPDPFSDIELSEPAKPLRHLYEDPQTGHFVAFASAADVAAWKHVARVRSLGPEVFLLDHMQKTAMIGSEVKTIATAHKLVKFGYRDLCAQPTAESLCHAFNNLRLNPIADGVQHVPVLHFGGYYANWMLTTYANEYLREFSSSFLFENKLARVELWPPTSMQQSVPDTLRRVSIEHCVIPGHNLLTRDGRKQLVLELIAQHAAICHA